MRKSRAALENNSSAPYDFQLPADQIAIEPCSVRESSRLLVYDRPRDRVEHAHISDVARWLVPGDLLVLNSARVDPVRIEWKKLEGAKEELLLLKLISSDQNSSRWEAIVSGRNLRLNFTYRLPGEMDFILEERGEGGVATVRLSAGHEIVRHWLESVGQPPLPPYIRKERKRRGMEETLPQDAKRYQTDFSRQSGAVAAPTAGLHFSQSLLENLRSRGIEIEFIHLSVGWGTFQPLTEEHWKSGRLHAEWVEISESASQRILKQKSKGKRVIAVGTTVVRALEWWHPRKTLKGWCDLFLRPPWKSEIVDAMVTNFHLPGSSLLVLVGSFIDPEKGRDRLLKLYEEAVQAEYRFYSYGDAMLIL